MPDKLRKRPAKDRAAFDVDRLQYEVGDEMDKEPGTIGTETTGEKRSFGSRPSYGTKDRTPGAPKKDPDVKKG